jgi:hypothetical protein
MTLWRSAARTSFRSVVIEALGDHKAAYALPTLAKIAEAEGPLQRHAVMAMGKIGDKKSLEIFVALQRTAPRSVQPAVAAAICLVGVNCQSHQGYLASSMKFAIENPGFQDLLRAATAGLAALAVAGSADAATALIVQGGPTRDPERAPIALALGTVALRNTRPRAEAGRERRAGRPGDRAAAGRLRHARRGFRGGALLRGRPPRVLAGARRGHRRDEQPRR